MPLTKSSQVMEVYNEGEIDVDTIEKLLKDFGIPQDKIDDITQTLKEGPQPTTEPQEPEQRGLVEMTQETSEGVRPALKPGKPLDLAPRISLRLSAKNNI